MKILNVLIILIFAFLGAVCVHWGLTVKDTASGASVLVGAFLLFFALKFSYLLFKRRNL